MASVRREKCERDFFFANVIKHFSISAYTVEWLGGRERERERERERAIATAIATSIHNIVKKKLEQTAQQTFPPIDTPTFPKTITSSLSAWKFPINS